MTVKQILVITGVSTLLILGLVRYCDRPITAPTAPGTLAPGEKERVEVHGRTVTVIRADKTVKTYAPNGAKVRIGDNGSVNVDISKAGFMHEPGMSVMYGGDAMKLALDCKLAYFHRAGFHLGGSFNPRETKVYNIVKPLAFVSYALPFDGVANTSLWVGTELFPQRLSGGLRLAF